MRNKKYKVKAYDDTIINVSMGQAKKVREAKRMANKVNGHLRIFPNLTFAVVDRSGNYIIGNETKTYKLNAIRKKIGNMITE